MDAWILRSKFSPPAPPAHWLRRRLDAGPATLLFAGPGYGKTLALLSLLHDARDQGLATLWYNTDAEDGDAAAFFQHLAAGMALHVPQVGDALRALASGELDPKRLWRGFFDALASFNLPPFMLLFDDFQIVVERQPRLASALMAHAGKLPPGLRIAVATRKASHGLPAAVRVLGAGALRFSPTEERDFMRIRAGNHRVPTAWTARAKDLDGWPLGLDLATSHLPAEGLGGRAKTVDRLAEYVSQELFLAQPPERRAFMLEAAILHEVTPRACAEVFGRTDAARELEALEAEHLIQRADDGASYRFPRYLREFLRGEVDRAIALDHRASWHARAAAYHLRHQQPELAIPHHLAGAAWEDAKGVTRTLFPLMRFDGRHVQARRWLEAFPPTVAADDPWLQLWRGHAQARDGGSAPALVSYERAHALYQGKADEAGAFKALIGLLNTHLTLMDFPAFERRLAEARSHAGERADEDVVDLWLIRAAEGERAGDMAAMRACNEAGLGIPIGDNIEIAASHCIARMNLFTFAMHQGLLAQARRHIEEAGAIAALWPFYPYRLASAFLEAHLHLTTGDLEAAGALLGALPAYWPEVLDWHDKAIAHTVLGHYHQARGQDGLAEEALNQALVSFTRAGYREGRKVPLERLMWLALQRRQHARVEAFWREAGAGTSPHDLALAIPGARAAHLAGRPEQALAALTPTRQALEAQGARLHVCRARLYEAATLGALGRTEEAGRMLAEALTTIERDGFGFLVGQDQLLWEELQALPQPAEDTPAPRVLPVVEDGPPKLSLRCFGRFEVRRGGIVLDQWPRRKAKLLLAALALRPDGVPAAELAALLADDDADPRNVLRVNSWALRRALEPDLGKGEASSYLLAEGDARSSLPSGHRLSLSWARVEFLDLDVVNAELDAGDACHESAPREACVRYEAGLAAMRGNLFEGFPGFEEERERYRERAVQTLLWLCAHHRKLGDYRRAEAALQRAAELAPTDEAVYLGFMRLYRALGQTDKLRRAYWDCRRALKTGQDRTPSAGFEATYRQLAGGG